jgi:photosystem II stability/assembly factor-like uncharacterized protein
MFFVDANIGWVVDGGGQILKTSDGGQNWNQQFYDSDLYFRSVEFFDEQVGFAGTLANSNPNAQLLKTDDGGQNWTDITANLAVAVPGICGMSVADANTLFVTGVFYGSAYIMKSTDRGQSWTYTDMANYCNGLVDIEFITPQIGFAVGQANQGNSLKAIIVGTTDGGDSWNVLATGNHANQRCWKIQFISDLVAYVSIEEFEPSPQYFKSNDGGQSWVLHDVVTTDTAGTMQGIGFLNEDLGWIGGWGELFYATNDGGQSWDYMPAIGSSFNRFFRIDEGLIYGSGLNVYKYVDSTLVNTNENILPPKPTGHSLEIAGSNIVDDKVTILLNLVNSTYCELSVYNILGKRVEVISQAKRNKGEHQVSWSCSKMPVGSYFLVLYTYHGYESIRFFVE